MDQIRAALGWLKRHHFWVLSVLAAMIALGCWWRASGTMSALYEKGQADIKAQFSGLDTLRNAPFHANTTVIERQTKEVKLQADEVQKIWQRLFDRQSENVLKWPQELSQEFRDYVEKRQFGDTIPPELRANYQNYAEGHFKSLPEKIGARVMSEEEAGSFGGPGEFTSRSRYTGPEAAQPGQVGAQIEDDDFICEWLDQSIVRRDLDFPQEPSPLRIWWTQENLWVYHTLLDVIAKTNQAANASRQSNAAVKVVQSLEVGRRAAKFSRKKGRVFLPRSATPEAMAEPGAEPVPGGEASEGPGGMPGAEGEMMMDPGEGGLTGPMTEEQEKASLLGYRYLGPDGKPIPMGGGAAVGGEAPAEPVPADPGVPGAPIDTSMFGVEYKRLPVRMVLEMDQRWLPRLIAECASQPLQVEVQEVRVNAPDSMDPNSLGGGGMMSGSEYGAGNASMFQEQAGIQSFSAQSNVVNVVIQGVIYIFNKPDPAKLKVSDEAETTTAAL